MSNRSKRKTRELSVTKARNIYLAKQSTIGFKNIFHDSNQLQQYPPGSQDLEGGSRKKTSSKYMRPCHKTQTNPLFYTDINKW